MAESSPKRQRTAEPEADPADAAPDTPADAAPDVPVDTAATPAEATRSRPALLRSTALRDRAKAFAESRGVASMRFNRAFVDAFAAHVDTLFELCLARALSNRRRTLMAGDV